MLNTTTCSSGYPKGETPEVIYIQSLVGIEHLKKKNEAEKLLLLDIQMYKARLIKTVWNWQKDRQIGQATR